MLTQKIEFKCSENEKRELDLTFDNSDSDDNKIDISDTMMAQDRESLHRVSVLGGDAIVAGRGLAASLAADVAGVRASAVVVVADATVARLHLRPLLDALALAVGDTRPCVGDISLLGDTNQPKTRDSNDSTNQPTNHETVTIKSTTRILAAVVPPGEAHKSRASKAALEDWLLAHAVTRDCCIVALGGGVVGDLVGFTAATFMRGVPVFQVPTTLLAMVDSSIGGKTAVDTPHGKNLVGAFHQPRRIYIDIDYLTTLPKREFVNGLAEVIKTAAIWNADDFEMLENHPYKILALVGSSNSTSQDPESAQLLLRVILGSVRVKAHVVTVDEKETGLRGLLNFGHSVGHAIEAIMFPNLLHGECVAIGMVKEAEIARFLGHLNNVSVGRLVRCLQMYGLPVSLDDKIVVQRAPGKHCTVDRLLDIMRVDKKNQGDRKRMVLLAGIGKTVEPRASFVADDVIRKILSPAVRVYPSTRPVDVRLAVPGSKSISNRALVMAALGQGVCRLRGLLHSDDVQVMLDALQKIVGITYIWEDDGNTLVITGGGGKLHTPASEIYLGNAGTAARFLTTVCTLIRAPPSSSTRAGGEDASSNVTVLTGNARMKQRPIGPLVNALCANACSIEYIESQGCLPLCIHANANGLPGGTIHLSAAVSSQYVSSILISAPYASSPVTLDLTGDAVVSQPYIDMTIAMMASFGVHVQRVPGTNKYMIPTGVYTNPPEYFVEADASSATYPLAFAAITGSRVTVTNMGSESLQGDAEFAVKVLRQMGCDVDQTATTTTVRGPSVLRPLPSIDMETMTDAFMTAVVLAAVAQSPVTTAQGNSTESGNIHSDDSDDMHVTRITGIANQRVKECDRIAAMIEQLALFGVSASELPDGILVRGIQRDRLLSADAVHGVKCYDDHRIAMSFSILASVVPASSTTSTRDGGNSGGSGVIITEKKCVEKTWPSWWDTLENVLGVKLEGADVYPKGHFSANHTSTVSTTSQRVAPRVAGQTSVPLTSKSLVLIGMRGAGKTQMGRAIARALDRTFIDMDIVIESSAGKTIPDIIRDNGWEAFRRIESDVLVRVLRDHPTGAVIATGGGVVESIHNQAVLTESTHVVVVHIRRDMNDVEKYLGVDKTRPTYGEDVRTVWARREPLYRRLSHAEFVIPAMTSVVTDTLTADMYWDKVESAFERFVQLKLMLTPRALSPASASASTLSSFVSLTCTDVTMVVDTLSEITQDTDAVELRVDLLASTDRDFVATQVSLLRLHTELPIVFTIRTCAQGGKFPNDRHDDMIALLHDGIRWGCDYIDVELTPPYTRFDALLRSKGNAMVIGSYHDCRGVASWDHAKPVVSFDDDDDSTTNFVSMRRVYDALSERCDIVKLIGVARTPHDNIILEEFRHAIAIDTTPDQASKPRLIALMMGEVGKLSRVMNTFMTPVTHGLIPTPAAPGQLSIAEIRRLRHDLGIDVNVGSVQQRRRRQFYLFGRPISSSMSPVMHNTGFNAIGVPYQYHLHETDTWETVMDMIRGITGDKAVSTDTVFGGASVTIPLKVDVYQYLRRVGDHDVVVSDAVRAIGAVNTIGVAGDTGDAIVYVDNTDWVGILRCVDRHMRRIQRYRNRRLNQVTHHGSLTGGIRDDQVPIVGVVIGAGGTARAACYALAKMTPRVHTIRVWNRTLHKAQSLAKEFNNVVETMKGDGSVKVVSAVESLADAFGTVGMSSVRPIFVVIGTIPADAQASALDDACGGLTAALQSVVCDADAHGGESVAGVVVDMAYQPRETRLLAAARRVMTTVSGVPTCAWATVEGIDVLIEQGVEQFWLWTGRRPPVRAMKEAVYAAYE